MPELEDPHIEIANLRAELEARDKTIQALIEYQEASRQQAPLLLQNVALTKAVERKTRALEGSQQFLEAVIDTLDSELCILDARGAIVRVNQSWKESRKPHKGPSPSLGLNYVEVCRELAGTNPGFPQHAAFAVEQILRGDRASFHSVFCEPEGHRDCWYQMRVIPLLDASLGTALVLHRDITELIEAQKEIEKRERELLDREAYFRAITEGAHDPIVMLDQSGKIHMFNHAASRTFGYLAHQVQGEFIQKIVPKLDAQALGKGSESAFVLGLHSEQRPIPLRLSISRLELSSGERHYSCIFHDLTELRQMEQDLAQARKLESIGQLAAGIAHEINTPLQYLADNFSFVQESSKSCLELLGRMHDSPTPCPDLEAALENMDFEYLREEMPEALQQSIEGLERITNIVLAMREFSHLSVEKSSADLNAGIMSTVTVTRNEWKYIAELTTVLDPNLGNVCCYLSDLKQVVLNLIVNASHAIADQRHKDPDFKGRIQVSSSRQGDCVRVAVTDNGPGIPRQVRHRIFDPFFTTKEVGLGTGQGLSIARRIIVERHLGEIDFECPPEGGTTFWFTIPIEREHRAA